MLGALVVVMCAPSADAGRQAAPLTAVMLTVAPNPAHQGDSVRFQWTATGFHGTVTCHDDRGWLVNGSYTGTLTKVAGSDFTASFRWTVYCDDGDFFAQSYVDVTYVPAPPPPPPPPPPPAVSIVDNNPSYVTFRNPDGDWTVWKACSSVPNGATVGPGYIAKLVTPDPGRITVLNDNAGAPGGLNAMQGGPGAFGLHYARGNPPFDLESSSANSATDLTGRHCSWSGTNPGPKGVYRVDLLQGPLVSGGVGIFDLTVWIRDYWGDTGYGPDDPAQPNGIGDAGLKITYQLRVYGSPSVVKLWAGLTTYFGPNGAGTPFAKESKFSGSLPNTTMGYRRIAVFGGADGMTFLRAYNGTHAQGSIHSYEDNRLRVRYDFAPDTTAGSDPLCSASSPCMNLVYRAILPSGSPGFWEKPAGSNGGLDKWATDVALASHPTWPRVDTVDHANVNPGAGLNYPWNCNATTDKTAPFANPEESTGVQAVRGWEFGGIDPGNGYTQLMMLANGWEGGRSFLDCESTSMKFPSPGTSYSAEMDYSLNNGWEP